MGFEGRGAHGDVLAGYVLEELLGRGGMGEVYRARDLRLERPVALKVLPPRLADDERYRERLLRESRLAAALDHPNVVPIYETGEAEGRLFIAMRCVEGTDLKSLLAHEGPLAPERTVAICAQVAAALDAAHARGLVHRDVKPSNVLLDTADGREHVYLADFGLTASASEAAVADGQLMGTLEYVAPEQVRGEAVDGRADTYALGCVMFEALTGSLPYAGASDVALIYAHLEQPPPAASERRPGLPTALDDVLARAMAKDPQDRPSSCAALVAEVAGALGVGDGARQRLRRNLIPLVGVAGALAALVAAIVVLLTQGAAPAAAAPPGSLVRIDPARNAVTGRFPLGAHPETLAVAGGRVWAVSRREGTLWQVNPATGRVNTIKGPGSAQQIAGSGNSVYVISASADFAQGFVTPYDAVSAQPRSGLNVHGCSITADPGFGIGVAECPFVERVVDRGGALRSTFTIPIPFAEPRRLETTFACLCSMSVGFGDLWVAGDEADGRVWRIDRSGRVAATIEVPFGVRTVAAGEGGVWVTGPIDDRVARIDPETNRVSHVVASGRGARGVAAGAGGVWVADAIDGDVLRIDPVSREPVARVHVGGHPTEVAVGDGSVWVTVNDAP